MNDQKIYMKTWLTCHGRVKIVDTDQWYLDFANRLVPFIAESSLYKNEMRVSQQMVALLLTFYLEDCVADGGNWREFIHWHQKNYGRYLPFYTLTGAYLADEINKEDIALVLWGVNSPIGEEAGVENPFEAKLLVLAEVIYKQMDAVFEEAPISTNCANDWFLETAIMEKNRTPLAVATLDEEMPINVERFLNASGGKDLMYFGSYTALRLFFVQALLWKDNDDELLNELQEFDNFVLYANPRGILIGMDIASYFADKRNPMYDAEQSEDEAYELCCEQGLCPFDLLKYGMEHNLLPDAQFPFADGKRLLHENWDFISRWFLGEYYEGK